jgi:hypothetical protein
MAEVEAGLLTKHNWNELALWLDHEIGTVKMHSPCS